MVTSRRAPRPPAGRRPLELIRDYRQKHWAGIWPWIATSLATFCLMLIPAAGYAADPQPYSVSIAATGDTALDGALAASSQLINLRDQAPVGPFALVIRARQDVDRYETVLQSFGYYQALIDLRIDDQPLDMPDLVDRLAADDTATVTVTIDRGPLFHLRAITIDGDMPPTIAKTLALNAGQPAIAADVLAAGIRLQAALQEDGFALATVDTPIASEDPAARAIDVTFKVTSGRRAVIGPILFTGLAGVQESFVRQRLLLRSGQPYRPSSIERARQDLASLTVFSGVSVHIGAAIAEDGSLPVTFDFRERPVHLVGVTGAFSTDLGGSVKTSWSDRNLFGNAEQLNLTAAGTGIGGSDVVTPGYNLTAQLITPDVWRRDQSFEVDLSAFQQDLEAYDERAVTAAIALTRKLSSEWSARLGLSAEKVRVEQQGVTRGYELASLPWTLKYDSTGLTDTLKDPTSGMRATLSLTPSMSFGASTAFFVIAQLSGSAYLDLATAGLSDPGRSVVALRGLVGSVEGAGQFDLPPDQRFYGGGSGTVRGFKYQSIGPLFANNDPAGGTAIDAGAVEFRQRLFDDFGVAAFVDGGQVNTRNVPFEGKLQVGTGTGLRYYTAIGVVRFDVALPVDRPPGGDHFEFYVGLGQAF